MMWRVGLGRCGVGSVVSYCNGSIMHGRDVGAMIPCRALSAVGKATPKQEQLLVSPDLLGGVAAPYE